MRISDAGLALIKQAEGGELTAYQDAAGVWTIGYGHTRGVKAGDRITQAQAEALLREDIRVAETVVSTNVKTALTQHQADALCSFVFNLGAGHFVRSALLKKLNAGDINGAADEFSRWIYADGKRLNGLVRRRAAERALFLS